MSKKPVRVAVTGAAGQIGYALLFRIASGEMLGKDQPVILQLLEVPVEGPQKALKGVMMELEDCAFPLLAGMEAHSDPMTAFKDTDYALLVGSMPRKAGMERAELLSINGKIFIGQGQALDKVASRDVKVSPSTTLLDLIRDHLGLTGTKKGCDAGQCGACTVLVGGKRVVACLTLAAMAQGKDITTIEGLAGGDGALHPMQQAFVEHDGLQCGYCTPGQIVSAVALVREGRAKSDDEVREQMSGNLCRCGAYPNIVAAIQSARRGRG